MGKNDYITTSQAKKELGENEYYVFCRWLREKGYNNLTESRPGHYKHEIFATHSQLNEFVTEQIRDFKGSDSTNTLWGQSRELLSEKKR